MKRGTRILITGLLIVGVGCGGGEELKLAKEAADKATELANSMTKKNETLQKELTAAKQQAADLQTKLTAAQAALKTAETNVTALQEKLKTALATGEKALAAAKKAATDAKKAAKKPEGPKMPKTPGVVDPGLSAAVKAVITGCNVNKRNGWVSDCKNKELETLRALAKTKGLKTALETYSVLVASPDKTTRHLVANELGSHYAGSYPPPRIYKELKANPSVLTADMTLRFIHALKKHTSSTVSKVAPIATHGATLTGNVPTLFFVLDKHSDKYAKRSGVVNLLVMGRLKYFPKLKQLVGWGDEAILESALTAATHVQEPTAAELAVICPWGKGYLGHKNKNVLGEVTKLMTKCGGTYIDALLDETDRRLKAQKFQVPRSLVNGFPAICTGYPKKAGTEAQCARTLKTLQSIAENEFVDWVVRGEAVRTIGGYWKTPETLALLRKYEASQVPHVKWRAKERIRNLKKWHKVTDGKPVDATKTPRFHDWYTSTYKMKAGDKVTIWCPPNGKLRTVYGSGTYSGSSSICSAAVHAGKITAAKGGAVKIKVSAGRKKYEGTQKNGVKSQSQSWPAKLSYSFI